ncbi:unnamed protein product [Orchesella dallaii]|uniref:Uncharacterized protein n=1 Tax=Orchesella dallaii TaxID=48710 RepID=A0ABP1PRE0_9HEXA
MNEVLRPIFWMGKARLATKCYRRLLKNISRYCRLNFNIVADFDGLKTMWVFFIRKAYNELLSVIHLSCQFLAESELGNQINKMELAVQKNLDEHHNMFIDGYQENIIPFTVAVINTVRSYRRIGRELGRPRGTLRHQADPYLSSTWIQHQPNPPSPSSPLPTWMDVLLNTPTPTSDHNELGVPGSLFNYFAADIASDGHELVSSDQIIGNDFLFGVAPTSTEPSQFPANIPYGARTERVENGVELLFHLPGPQLPYPQEPSLQQNQSQPSPQDVQPPPPQDLPPPQPPRPQQPLPPASPRQDLAPQQPPLPPPSPRQDLAPQQPPLPPPSPRQDLAPQQPPLPPPSPRQDLAPQQQQPPLPPPSPRQDLAPQQPPLPPPSLRQDLAPQQPPLPPPSPRQDLAPQQPPLPPPSPPQDLAPQQPPLPPPSLRQDLAPQQPPLPPPSLRQDLAPQQPPLPPPPPRQVLAPQQPPLSPPPPRQDLP